MSYRPSGVKAGDSDYYFSLTGSGSPVASWYLFPSQNGQITLDDGGPRVLESVGGQLFYDGQVVSTGGGADQWSTFPQVSNVNSAGFDIGNAGIIQATDLIGSATISGAALNTTGNATIGGVASVVTVPGQIAGGSMTLTGGLDAGLSGVICSGLSTTGAGPIALNGISTGTLSATGAITSGTTIAATGNLSGGSITTVGTVSAGSVSTTGGLDMINTAITRASSVGISNAGFAPYGSLTSPDGINLTWNGAAINTGGSGSAAGWSNFPAISGNVDLAGSTIGSGAGNPITMTAATNLGLVATAGNVTTTASSNIAENAGANYNVTVDRGASIGLAANLNLTAQNGLGGNIVLNSEGGFSVLGQQVGFGAIELNALGAANQAFALGGRIDLNAYSAGIAEYGGFTSRVSASAATIALSAGAAPTFPGLAGSMNIFGQGAVSIVASIVPPILPQVPETIYMYGLLGLRMESPAGIQMLSDTYMGNVYPIAGGDLVLQGRTLPDGYVRVEDCTNIDMVGVGAITGVQTINGVAYPPPVGDVADWATFPAIQNVDMAAFKITNMAAGTAGTDATNFTQLTFRDTTEFYVSTQGNDANNGSILSPKLTIQAAITAAELISSAANICVINVASGLYTENLTFAKGYVVLNGSLQSQTGNEVCEITGSVSIACVGPNDLFNRQVTFQGFNITCGVGQSITDTSTSSHTVTFQDCKCFVNSVFFNSTTTAPDMRFYLTNVEVSQTNTVFAGAVITTNVGLVEIERLDLTVDGNAIGLAVGGTSVLSRCSLSTLENTNIGVLLRPLINITSSSLSAHSLGNVAFAFTSSVAKVNTNALAIASSVNSNLIMLNCVFTLAGTGASTNNCVGYNGVGTPTIAGINNTSLNVNLILPQTTSVQSGITQIQYTNIQPPGLASYSSSVDQSVAVAATFQALTFNTTQFNQGTTLLAGSRVYVSAQGNYALNYIIQLTNTAGASHEVTSFLKKNGAIIINTGSNWTIDNAHNMSVSKENIVALNIGDYVEVFFTATATGVAANATGPVGITTPAIPSVVFNIKQFR
jgi:hypothetical protein